MMTRDLTNNKQTEEALRESEERFRTVFEFAPMGIAIANKEGMLLQTNQAFQEILGYTAEELQNLPFSELTHPDDRAENLKLFQELLAAQHTHFSVEKRYLRKDGRIVWCNVSVSGVCNPNGLVQYAFAMIQDISAQKQAQLDLQKTNDELEKRVAERTAELEQANTLLRQEIANRQQAQETLQAQHQFLQTVLDSNPNMIFVKDRAGRVVLANQAYADFRGTIVEDLLGKTDAEFNPNQAEVEQFRREDQEIFTRLQPKFIPEETCRTATGEVRWYQIIKKPIFSSDGQVYGVLGVCSDITEGKLVEEALRENEQRYRLLIEGMNDGVIVLEENSSISYVNEKLCEMLGYFPSEMIGHPICEFVDEGSLKIVQEQTTRRRRGESGTYELGLKRKDGQTLLSLASGTPILGTDGSLEGSFGVITDITALKAVESELQQATEQLQAVLDAVPGFVSWISSEGRYLGVNQHLAKNFNLSPDAFVGKELGFLKNSSEFVQFMKQFLATPAQTDRQVIETQINDSTRNYLIVAQKYNQGSMAVSVGIDITERKQVEEALHRSEARFRLAIDNIPNVFAIYDAQRRFQYVNAEGLRRSGKSLEEHLGYTDEEIWPNEITHQYLPILKRAVETGTIQTGECTISLPNSAIFTILVTYVPLLDEGGKVYQILGITHDITARKQVEARIRESLREKEVLLQEIHHRVKNNLQVISSLLDLQSQHIGERSTLELFRESCNRVKSMALVHEKLYESKDCAKINFSEYIESLIGYLFQVYAGRAENITLELHIDEVTLNIDTAIPCGLIISELVSNALKYAFANNQKGVINVDFYSEFGNKLILIVKDNGIGLPVNFDIKGVKSLGLQLVNILTNQLDGTLEINPRAGTEFKIRFSQTSC